MLKTRIVSTLTTTDKSRGITTTITACNIVKSEAKTLHRLKETRVVVYIPACIPSIFKHFSKNRSIQLIVDKEKKADPAGSQ